MSRLPDFLVIGAQRAGTTSFYEYLTKHPKVRAAERKETHYFSLFYGNGERWYRKQFPGRSGTTGEATPYYLFHPGAPKRAHSTVPDVKLIVLLRDPVERAFSQYQHSVKNGWENLPFEEALRAEADRLAGEEERLMDELDYRSFAHQHQSYIARGRYANQLEEWTTLYGRERLLVLSSERFYNDPAAALSATFDFLGLSVAEVGPFEVHNASSYTSPMDPQTRTNLKHAFRDDNERLFAMLDDDLGWNG